MTNTELQNIYFGAYSFDEKDGYLMSYQYTKEQIAYFKEAFEFWYERCTASTAKTLEFTTDAQNISFDYKFFWKGSEDSFELCVDGLITDIRYVKELSEEGTIKFELPEGTKDVMIYLPADATVGIKNFEIDASVSRQIRLKRYSGSEIPSPRVTVPTVQLRLTLVWQTDCLTMTSSTRVSEVMSMTKNPS